MFQWDLMVGWIADTLVFFDFMCRMRERRYSRPATILALIVGKTLLISVIINFYDLVPLKLLCTFSIGLLSAVILFRGTFFQNTADVIFFSMFCILGELASYLIVIAAGGSIELIQTTFWRIVISVFTYLTAFLLCRIFSSVRKKTVNRYKNTYIIIITAIALLVILEMTITAPLMNPISSDRLLSTTRIYELVCALLGVVNMLTVIIMLSKMERYVMIEEGNRIKEQCLSENLKQYDEMLRKYSELRKLRHDFANHVQTIYILSEQGNSDAADKYISQLIKTMEDEK